MAISLIGCSQKESREITVKNNYNPEDKSLVVYFSMPETKNPDNMTNEEELSTVIVDGEVLGNTQYVATIIAPATNGDTFRIEPVIPYPLEHSQLEDIAQEEQNKNLRPEISGKIENIEQYDIIYFGFPNWYYDMPMIMYSFLDEYDLSNKTLVPFVTSGASGFSDSINTIKEMELDAYVDEEGLSILRNDVQDSKSDIVQWLKDKGYLQ